MSQNGQNLEAVQAMNRTLLLRLLQQNHVCSRANLAVQSGLKQATITNIINDFISWGIVEETGLIEGSKGRRAIGIQLKQDQFYVIGLRLSRKYFEIGIFTLLGELVGEAYRENVVDTFPSVVLPKMKRIIRELIQKNPDKRILAVGVAVPGPYYYKEDLIEVITSFPGWKKVPIMRELQRELNIPVIVDHDANAGVLAECSLGLDPSVYETVVYVAVGQGIGAGIFHKGRIFRGATGIAGEIGHASVDLNGPLCECGNRGCLTACASTLAFVERVNTSRKMQGRETELCFGDLIELIRKKDTLVYKEFQEVMRYLSAGIVNLIYSYNPRLIIIGDEMSRIGSPVLEEIKKNLDVLSVRKVVDQAELRLTSFELDSAFVGAAEVAIDYTFVHTELFRN